MTLNEVSEYLKKSVFRYDSLKNARMFLFGSVLTGKRFHDVDVGFMGAIDPVDVSLLREEFENSTFPYKLDVVDFNTANDDFKQKVFNDGVLWLTQHKN